MNNAAPEDSPCLKTIATSFSHRGFILIGASLILFEIVFLFLYVNSFWLPFNLLPWGIPSIVCVAVLAHYLLLLLESPQVCAVSAAIFSRKPPIVYWRWAKVDEAAITFGIRRILWQSIDEANLTMFGNLVLKSRLLCGASSIASGKETNPGDVIVKMPFSALALSEQKKFVEMLQARCPVALLNNRLIKQTSQPLLKGIGFVQGLAVVFLAAALIDFGYSEFRHLEILKEYFLCQKDVLAGTTDDAALHLSQGEEIRLHPLPISWISNKVMTTGTIAAGITQARSQALWALGRHDEAIAAALEAAEQAPKSYSYHLRLARLYKTAGKESLAIAEIAKIESEHKDALLPRLYELSMLLKNNQPAQAKAAYDDYMKELKSEVFTDPVVWPPGGEPFLHELFHEDDLDFVFGPVFDRKPK